MSTSLFGETISELGVWVHGNYKGEKINTIPSKLRARISWRSTIHSFLLPGWNRKSREAERQKHPSSSHTQEATTWSEMTRLVSYGSIHHWQSDPQQRNDTRIPITACAMLERTLSHRHFCEHRETLLCGMWPWPWAGAPGEEQAKGSYCCLHVMCSALTKELVIYVGQSFLEIRKKICVSWSLI